MKTQSAVLAAPLAIALLTAFVFVGCRKAAPPEPDVTPPPATPAPVAPPPATPPPATPSAELAPPGVFYLLTAARVETADGITGLPPGTGVKLVRPGIYLTPAGEVALDATRLTNDMAKARAVLSADRNSQAALRAGLAVQEKQAAQIKAAQDAQAVAAPTPNVQYVPVSQPAAKPAGNPLDKGTYNTNTRALHY